jgi:hypothetical protein
VFLVVVPGACCPNGTERGCPTRSSQDCQMAHEIPRGLGLSNVLRLRQPRSAVSKMIWATRPLDVPWMCPQQPGTPEITL